MSSVDAEFEQIGHFPEEKRKFQYHHVKVVSHLSFNLASGFLALKLNKLLIQILDADPG